MIAIHMLPKKRSAANDTIVMLRYFAARRFPVV